MFESVVEGGQFLVATHSPLLAYPGARIYPFDHETITPMALEDTDLVRITRDFLADPMRYLRHLGSRSE